MRDDTDDCLALFLNDTPLLDLRAPVEFAAGAFPAARNLCLLDDEQRRLVGIRYKEAGQDAAIALGEALATPALREARLAAWTAFCREHPEGYLYCFRGGLRSHTTQAWLRAAGVDYPLVRGGYKAMRRFLVEALARTAEELPLLVLSGRTGSGKTQLLRRLPRHVDLEGLARHRGSAFGLMLEAQPAQIDWENAVSIALLKLQHAAAGQAVLLEDEGRLIGRIHVPPGLQQRLRQAPKLLLETPLEARCHLIREEYVDQQWPRYLECFGAAAHEQLRQHMLGKLGRIRKRLGDARHARVHALFEAGLAQAGRFDQEALHAGIRILLEEYYDPLYQYQLERSSGPILARGPAAELRDFVQQRMGLAA